MGEPDRVDDLMERLQNGAPRGVEGLFARYSRRLARVAELPLSRKLAGRMGGEDADHSALAKRPAGWHR